jgi:hypothetical protein
MRVVRLQKKGGVNLLLRARRRYYAEHRQENMGDCEGFTLDKREGHALSF